MIVTPEQMFVNLFANICLHFMGQYDRIMKYSYAVLQTDESQEMNYD